MKAISASIVVMAAAVILTGGSFIQHSDTRLFVQVVGCLVAVMGLTGWAVSLRER